MALSEIFQLMTCNSGTLLYLRALRVWRHGLQSANDYLHMLQTPDMLMPFPSLIPLLREPGCKSNLRRFLFFFSHTSPLLWYSTATWRKSKTNCDWSPFRVSNQVLGQKKRKVDQILWWQCKVRQHKRIFTIGRSKVDLSHGCIDQSASTNQN